MKKRYSPKIICNILSRARNLLKEAVKTGNLKQTQPQKQRVDAKNIQLTVSLSRSFFKYLRSGSVLLYLGVQFVHIVGHRNKQNLR